MELVMQVSIREVKNSLSKYLKLVQMGKDVVITDRGRPVARLTLVASTPEQAEAEAIQRILALPWVRPGKGGKLKGAKTPISWKPGDKLASDMVIEDRI
jgi:prevent-host-death family protein